MATNLKLIRLISGEELMSEVTAETDTVISIKNPVRVVLMPNKVDPKTPTVGFAPWVEFSEEKDFTIHKAHVIVTMKPVQEFINQYNSMFGGIVSVPTTKLIIPGM
ncbi:Sm-like domain containing protein [uncultured Caudovirales phage]|uniref:Sm-like domain containing protein n=1 Tax=uncultured Caudovirales phage TaxID=2100421 RepID=A0A6J5SB45_9CAUD|nr:Sm-like domain containing protein [uncultured Caudovirales phage]CAB4176732.1 Sm-like domain containing protein [uncultured Caudovirales phage]CAB4181963.1 Sm-like domain containing protein [uncultured Caudovirales phage]CAB4190462.1 Sm-like domain containing protein [uncultured Caudovirales phage]CAB4210902.1 Sm-like domain containing protein [uncultured Caudovirales phage]